MFLEGKTVSVSGFDSETESELTEWILETGGEIISKNSTKIVDFLVVPFKSDITKSKKVKEVVTNLWLEGKQTGFILQRRSEQQTGYIFVN
jgi:hypothetical protein